MKRKNILFIMADQMAAPMLPIYAPSPIKLPNISREIGGVIVGADLARQLAADQGEA